MNLSTNPCPPELLTFFIGDEFAHLSEKPDSFDYGDLPRLPNNDVQKMLSYLNPDMPYDDWCMVGMALHEGGYDVSLWDNWSARGAKYKPLECQKKWNSFNGSKGVTMGTLIHMAKQFGWIYPNSEINQHDMTANKQDNKQMKKFEFVQVGEFIKNIKPISWLINGYIESHTLSLLFGDPASGKSFLAIDMALSVATGHEWHGKPVKKGAVFYIAGEGGNGLRRRFEAWSIHNDLDITNAPLYVSIRPVQLYDADSAHMVKEAVQELSEKHDIKPKLIIIDTLARNFGGADENSTKDMNQFVYNIDELKDTWQASAMIVHHTGHSDKGRARGSMALKGALDHEFRVEKKSDSIVSLANTKMKDGETPDKKYFEFVTVDWPTDSFDTITSAILVETDRVIENKKGVKLTARETEALETLKKLLDYTGKRQKIEHLEDYMMAVDIQEFKDELKMANIFTADKEDSIRKAITRAIDGLKTKGIISFDDTYIWLMDKEDNSDEH